MSLGKNAGVSRSGLGRREVTVGDALRHVVRNACCKASYNAKEERTANKNV